MSDDGWDKMEARYRKNLAREKRSWRKKLREMTEDDIIAMIADPHAVVPSRGSGGSISFRQYVRAHMPEFYEKYRLLIDG